jgi:ABC-2 type transport system permease protein
MIEAAGSTQHPVLRWALLGIIVIAIAVAAILLLQRYRDRRSPDESATPSEGLPAQGLPADPRRQDTASEWTKELPPGHYGLPGLLRAEWTKLRTVRSTMWTVGFTVLTGVALAVIFAAAVRTRWATMTPAKRANFDPIGVSMVGVYFGVLTIGILGVLAISAEYSTGTVRATFCAVPRRPAVLAAKAIVFGILVLVISEITAFVSFFLAEAILTGPARHATIASPGALRAVAGSGLYLCIMGLLALGLATIIRHTAGAISAYAGLLLLFPIIAGQLPLSLDNDLTRFLPLKIGAATISGPPLANTFSPWVGLAVLAIYAVVLLTVGGVILVKRDA